MFFFNYCADSIHKINQDEGEERRHFYIFFPAVEYYLDPSSRCSPSFDCSLKNNDLTLRPSTVVYRYICKRNISVHLTRATIADRAIAVEKYA